MKQEYCLFNVKQKSNLKESNRFRHAIQYNANHIFFETIKKIDNNQYQASYVFFRSKWREDIMIFDNVLFEKIQELLKSL